MIELYAVLEQPPSRLPRPGLRSVPCGDLAVVCGSAAEEREPSAESLWRHEEIVEALMEEGDLLPVRFGTRVADERAAALAIASRRDELSAALARVRRAVELSVRARCRRPPAGNGDSGREYAERLRARAGEALVVHQPLAFLARDSHVRVAGDPQEVLRAAYLVDRDAVAGFVSLVRRIDARHPGLDLLCTGPWPPYSFVER